MSEDDLYIEICEAVREQLRELVPTERYAIVDDLQRSLAANGRPIRLPGTKTRFYCCWLGPYAFFYRELTRKELDEVDEDFGYFVVAMKQGPKWFMGQLGG
ncbi:hypothetical protein [Rugosimonospora africana]|uniref:hypothetical protein n=1 Tax=Rugosimonospora africana TaxID=556532 RepID=UPI001941D455|nr:hypothetical protein [Rugosimonospora africana]